MSRFNFIFFIGIILISLCFFFACEQTVEKSNDDDAVSSASSSVTSSSSSSDTSSSAASSSVSSSSSSYAFADNFNSYSSANPWTLAGGWTGTDPNAWSIVAGDTGNGVQNLANAGQLISSYSGTDYTVSVKFRLTAVTANQGIGLMARRTAANVYYAAEIVYFSGSDITRIAIYKANGSDGSQSGEVYKTGQLDTNTFYTLTLSVSGSVNPVITSTVTDGTTSQTTNWTDTGTTLGSVLTGPGYACIWANTAADSTIFDDFTVTDP